jgi:hypothetical protein
MKYKDLTAKTAQGHSDYISKRWSQLSDIGLAWSNESIKYLFLINSGAAATVLAFIGAVDAVRGVRWAWAMLICFTIGIIFVGLLHVARTLRIKRIYKLWRQDTALYYDSKLDWEALIEGDDKRSYGFSFGPLFFTAAFGCFIVGVSIGALNYNSVIKGEDHGRKQQAQQTIHPTTPPAIPAPKIDSGKRSGLDQKRPPDDRVGSPAPSSSQEKITTQKSKEKS